MKDATGSAALRISMPRGAKSIPVIQHVDLLSKITTRPIVMENYIVKNQGWNFSSAKNLSLIAGHTLIRKLVKHSVNSTS